jgi:hypothetical protein
MRNALKSAAIIVAIGTALAVSGLADAATVRIDFGNVSAGYRDGYRDTNNGWHSWRSSDASRYRRAHGDQYHAWRHDDRRHRDDADHR